MNTKNLFLIALTIATTFSTHKNQCAAPAPAPTPPTPAPAPAPCEDQQLPTALLKVKYREHVYRVPFAPKTTVAKVKTVLAGLTFFPVENQHLIAKYPDNPIGTYLRDTDLVAPLLAAREVILVAK